MMRIRNGQFYIHHQIAQQIIKRMRKNLANHKMALERIHRVGLDKIQPITNDGLEEMRPITSRDSKEFYKSQRRIQGFKPQGCDWKAQLEIRKNVANFKMELEGTPPGACWN